MEGLRNRGRDSSANILPEHYGTRKKTNKYILPIPTLYLVGLLGFLVSIFFITVFVESQLPTPLHVSEAPLYPDRFISERAMKHLIRLTDIGPRTTGSYENEVVAIKFFMDEIQSIISTAKPVHKVEVDIQKTSGAFPLTFLDGMTNVYKNVQNVIVRVSSQASPSAHSLLLNCHFDTVSGSPGKFLY